MNKNELSAEIAKRTGISRKDAEAAIVTMTEIVCEKLQEDEKVQIVGFGTYEVKHRPARSLCPQPGSRATFTPCSGRSS